MKHCASNRKAHISNNNKMHCQMDTNEDDKCSKEMQSLLQ